MDNLFDAKAANQLSGNNSNEFKTELERVIDDIKNICELGRNSLFIYDVSQVTIKELKKRGFKVTPGSDYGETTAFHVSW